MKTKTRVPAVVEKTTARARSVKTQRIALSDITVPHKRMRHLQLDKIDEIAESIKQGQLLQPIVVRPRFRGGGFLLVAGNHRLAAVRQLGHATIECRVLGGLSADQALLAEIDENLIHADLTPSERAVHYAERKRLYLKLHPETKQGGAPGKSGGGKKAKGAKTASFVADTAKRTWKSKRTVALDVARAESIDPQALADLNGTCLDKGDELDAMAKLSKAEQRKLAKRAKAGEKVSAKTRAKQVKRAEREVKLATKITKLPDAKFGVIVADPEWHDKVYSEETGMNRHPSNHYPTSDIEAIKERPVASIAAGDCVLFLWSTNQHMDVAIDVLRAWGFTYRSNYVWRKPSAGTGFWNRSRHEMFLIGTVGNPPCPAPGEQWESVIDADRGEHSAKPEVFLQMVEEYYPNVPKIELNRRGPARPGWSAWGNEAEVAPADPVAPHAAADAPATDAADPVEVEDERGDLVCDGKGSAYWVPKAVGPVEAEAAPAKPKRSHKKKPPAEPVPQEPATDTTEAVEELQAAE